MISQVDSFRTPSQSGTIAERNEQVARYGPVVMNTVGEIQQTLRELREGTFIKA